MLAKLLGLNLKGPYLSLEKEGEKFLFSLTPYKAGSWNLKCHVAVVQRRLRNVQKSVMHVQSCCFANVNLIEFFLLFSLPSSSLKLHIFVNHKNFAAMVTRCQTSLFLSTSSQASSRYPSEGRRLGTGREFSWQARQMTSPSKALRTPGNEAEVFFSC